MRSTFSQMKDSSSMISIFSMVNITLLLTLLFCSSMI